jgi:hypothetical protein
MIPDSVEFLKRLGRGEEQRVHYSKNAFEIRSGN